MVLDSPVKVKAPVSTPFAVAPSLLSQLAARFPADTDELLSWALAPVDPSKQEQVLASRRALALFHERTGQHAGSVCEECGDLGSFDVWAAAQLARLGREARQAGVMVAGGR